MADNAYAKAEALQQALHLALQIDPAKTTDPALREVWYTATLFQSAFDCYQKAAARVKAADFDLVLTIAQQDADHWAGETKRLGELFLQLSAKHRAAAGPRKASA
jgi:hypothetical protein